MPAEHPSLETTNSKPQSASDLGSLPPYLDVHATSRRAWVWGSLPALFLLGLSLSVKTADQLPERSATGRFGAPVAALTPTLRQGILPVSQTMVVGERGIAGFSTLRGTLEGAGSVRGRAPMAGQIARVLVKPGQKVAVNDRVLELTDASLPRSSSRAERVQNSAESAQVAAVNQQESLQYKMQAAQQRLAAAQKRVTAAQSRLAAARLVVQKLQRGETISAEDTKPAKVVQPPAPSTEKSGPPKEMIAARQKALADTEKAQQQAGKAADAVRIAARAVSAAEDDLKHKNQKVDELRAASEKVQKLFDTGAAKASDVDAARAGLEDAQSDAQAATTRLASARKESARLRQSETQAKSALQDSTKVASASLQKLQLFAEGNGKEAPAPREDVKSSSDTSASSLSLDEAVKMVRSAIEESDAASADARTIKDSVDAYERQVNQTKNRLDSSAQSLEAAQQRVLDETIERNLSIVRAPANGTVLSVASVATNVSPGQTIIQIGRSGALQVKLTDETGAWRELKTEAVLSAVVATPAAAPAAKGAALPESSIVTLRITEIEAPKPNEKQAIITAVVEDQNNGTAAPRLRQGMSLTCSVVKPGERRAILIPASSVITLRPGTGTVAVLTEHPAPAANSVQGEALQTHHIEWREVRLGLSNGVEQEVASGLNSGERIALQPAELQAYAKSTGSSEVRLESNV